MDSFEIFMYEKIKTWIEEYQGAEDGLYRNACNNVLSELQDCLSRYTQDYKLW